jgi:DeoR family fructose operon transcriptional repressor
MKSSRGIIKKRQQQLLGKLQEQGSINVDEAAHQLNVTPITIRRDLLMFEEKGFVTRFHGGARLNEGALKSDPAMAENPSKPQILHKRRIAEYAASLVEKGDTIFINTSSTCLLMLEYLNDKVVTIITNNAKAIDVKRYHETELIFTGGEFNDHKQSMVGEIAINSISRVVADKSFIGVSAIGVSQGVMSSGLQETAINSLMMKRCKPGNCFVLADGSKIGQQSNFISATINLVSTLITDESAPEDELKRIESEGVKVIVLKET